MKIAIAITVFFALFLMCISSEDNDKVSTDLPDLIEEIEKATNKNWSIDFGNREYILLRYKKEFSGFEISKSSPNESDPKVVFYEFYLYVKPKINPEKIVEYSKEAKDNYENLKKAALEQIKNETMKGTIYFYPNKKNEWELYLKYLKAENAFLDIPEYYYKDIGIKYMKRKSFEAKDKVQEKIFQNAKEQEQVILKLLTKYKL